MSDNRFVRYQLWIAVLTLVLTPVFTAGIVYWQLSLSQDAWREQYDIQQEATMQERRLQITNELYVNYMSFLNARSDVQMAGFRKTAYEHGIAKGIKIYLDAEAATLHSELLSARKDLLRQKVALEATLQEAIHLFDQTTAVTALELMKMLPDLHGELVLLESEEKALTAAIMRIKSGDATAISAVWAVYTQHVGDVSKIKATAQFQDIYKHMYEYIVKVKQSRP